MDISRLVLAGVLGLLMYATCAGGLFIHAPAAQVAVVVGAAVGVLAPGLAWSALLAAAAYALGATVGPTNNFFAGEPSVSTLAVLPWSVLAAAVALGTTWAVSRRFVNARLVRWIVVAVLLANLWVTVLESNSRGWTETGTGMRVPALGQLMAGGPAPQPIMESDDYFYTVLYNRMRTGQGFYDAFRQTYSERMSRAGEGPGSVLNIREPGLYLLLAALPGPTWIVVALLLLITGAALSTLMLLRDLVPEPLALPAVAAVASYSIPFATGLQVFYTEVWAGLLAVIACALLVRSQRSPKWRQMLVGSVIVSVLAVLTRELAGTLLVAGVLAAFVSAPERRRFGLVAWGTGLAVAALGYLVHAMSAGPYLTASPAGSGVWGKGGLDFALSALTSNTYGFGPALLTPIVLAALGYVGVVLLPDLPSRVFGIVVTCVPPVLFLWVGNSAFDTLSRGVTNYWGIAFMPVVYACVPIVVRLVPGASPGPTPEAKPKGA